MRTPISSRAIPRRPAERVPGDASLLFNASTHFEFSSPLVNDPSSTARDGAPGAPPKTRVYGVLGGIASGKSAVARILAGKSGLVLDADELVSELFTRKDFRERVAEAFGPG